MGLRGADLRGADLRGADLRGANLSEADLRGANLDDTTTLSPWLVCPPTGSFTAWKKARRSVVVELLIPSDAWRAGHIASRKCRASKALVVALYPSVEGDLTPTESVGQYDGKTIYRVGETVESDLFDMDPRQDCTNGIHFFLTREEAEAY